MIAPNDKNNALRILAIGLLPEEEKFLQNLVRQNGGELKQAHDDLDVWNKARSEPFDVFVLGQCEQIDTPSYLIWLLKGIANQSNIILIYSKITAEEQKRLNHSNSVHVLQRPIDVQTLMAEVEDIYSGRAERQDHFWSLLARFNPLKKKVKVG